MKGNKILYAGIAILILGIGFAVGTYAYYQTTITGSASGTVLAWQCTANNQTATFNMSMGSLYPGSASSDAITIRSTMDANYKIVFSNKTNMGSGSVHPYLDLYSDSAHTKVINNSTTLPTNEGGTISAGGTATVNIYWYWPYGTEGGSNIIDSYNNGAPSIKATVTCTQL